MELEFLCDCHIVACRVFELSRKHEHVRRYSLLSFNNELIISISAAIARVVEQEEKDKEERKAAKKVLKKKRCVRDFVVCCLHCELCAGDG